jgi:hypothetical protein
MNVETLGSGASQAATVDDAGKMFILTGTEKLIFNNVNLTGRRFEFFNFSGVDRYITFGAATVVNGNSSVEDIIVPVKAHVVVMGIGTGQYLAWVSNGVTPYIPS